MKVASEAPTRATSPDDGATRTDEGSPTWWVVAAAVLPLVPVFATQVPLKQIVAMLLKPLIGI